MRCILTVFLFERYLKILNTSISAVSLEDKSVSTATDQTVTCVISGLVQNTPVTWIDPDNNIISESETISYKVDQGTFVFGSKSAILTIKAAKLADLSSGDVYKCKLRSSLYPDNSPDVVKEMVLTLLSLGGNTLKDYIFIVLKISSNRLNPVFSIQV